MNSPREVEARHVGRVQRLLSEADTLVWQQPGFPAAHRPDVETLSQRVRIGTNTDRGFTFHPQLRRAQRVHLETTLARQYEVADMSQPAQYDPDLRELTFDPALMGTPDDFLRRLVYHNAATDTAQRPQIIRPRDYTDDQRERFSAVLQTAFEPTRPVTMDRTSIEKTGFRQIGRVDGLFVSDLLVEGITDLNKIYPTAVELVTDQIVRRRGDTAQFDTDAATGQVSHQGIELSPKFASKLYVAMRYVDWRHILDAFKTGDVAQTIDILHTHTNPPATGSALFQRLFGAIELDEQNLHTANLIESAFLPPQPEQ